MNTKLLSRMFSLNIVSLVLGIVVAPTLAATVPFMEDFSANAANWFVDFAGTTAPTYSATGGPDGGSFVSSSLNFGGLAVMDAPVVLRGQDNFGSSDGAFEGDWLGGGVTELSFWVRHDSDVPVSFFARMAPVNLNFPGAIALSFVPVPGGVWTQVTFGIGLSNPAIIAEDGTLDTEFDNVGKIQIGLSVPEGLAGVDNTFTFDLDKVSIVPEPASLALLGAGTIAFLARKRKRSLTR